MEHSTVTLIVMKAGQKTLKKRPRATAFIAPSQCLACDAENAFETKLKKSVEMLKREHVPVTYECQVCKNCGHTLLTVAQLDTRVRRTVEAYQTQHSLLTAAEVRRRRLALGCKTQQELSAAAPNIAIATLKRLEAGQRVQDIATDCLLRRELRQLEEKQKREALMEFLQEDEWAISRDAMTINTDTFSYSHWTTTVTRNHAEVCA